MSDQVPYTERRLDIICADIDYWKNAYFDLMFKRGSYINHLMTLNERLRETLAFRDEEVRNLYQRFNFVHQVGDTIYVDYKKLREAMLHQPQGLATSKYYRKP